MSITLLVIFKVSAFKELVSDGFGNSIVLFFIGVLIISAAINATTLMKRMTTFMLYHLGHRPSLIILTFLLVGMLLSAWITDMAVAAMLLPIGSGILRDAGAKPLKSNFGRALMIAAAWGPLIGRDRNTRGMRPESAHHGFSSRPGGNQLHLPGLDYAGFSRCIHDASVCLADSP